MIILDTNVISELIRPRPSESVVSWVSGHPRTELYTTTITESELLYGSAILPPGRRKDDLTRALEEMFARDFAGRLLAFDEPAARAYARIAAHRRQTGAPISQFDAQIAAIACSRGAHLATRNTDDFQDCGISVMDPWR